jgi:hypothetical protein
MFGVIACTSAVMLVASAVLTPWFLLRLPADYFEQPKPHLVDRFREASFAGACTLCLKNILGVALLVAGIAMLVLPGQGLVTIIIALMLIDFPRKFEAERWMIRRGKCLATINWLRRKRGKAPLRVSA